MIHIRHAVIVLLAFARPAIAGELVSAGPLAIRAPDGLVLGRDATAVVHVRSEPSLRLVTSAGVLSDLVADGSEQRATLTLPTEQFPQLAIVAAISADGTVRDWLAIPLAGQARVKVDTEPLASLVVRVGAAEFGPTRADARGVAHVDIAVPPGITHATTVATGKNGAIREKSMPLGARPFGRALAVCGELGDRVSVVATLPTGAPAPAAPKLNASSGALSPATMTAPGVFVAAHRADPAGDTAQIAAGFAGEDAATCTLRVPPEPPSAIRIVPDRMQFVAGSGAISLAITLEYPGARRALAISTITVDTDTGTVATPTHTDQGWTAVWTLPDAHAGKRSAVVSVRAAVPGGQLEAKAQIDLVAAAPARIDVTAPPRIRANGSSRGDVVGRVVDRFDNTVPSPKLAARARGRVSTFATRADGASTASYIAPRTRDPGDDIVELSDPASGLTARTTIRLDALPRRFALAARVGYFFNLGRVSTPVAAISADARLPVLDERLVAGLEVAGYSASFDVQAMDVAESVSGRITAAPVLARLAYRASLGPIDAWVGGGAGVAFTSSRLASSSSGTTVDSTARFAAKGFVGGAMRTGPGWIVVEAAYLHARLQDGPIVGRIGGILGTAGFAFEL